MKKQNIFLALALSLGVSGFLCGMNQELKVIEEQIRKIIGDEDFSACDVELSDDEIRKCLGPCFPGETLISLEAAYGEKGLELIIKWLSDECYANLIRRTYEPLATDILSQIQKFRGDACLQAK